MNRAWRRSLNAACLSILLFTLTSCAQQFASAPFYTVRITADGEVTTIQVVAGTTVANALAQGGVTLGELDRITPPLYASLADQSAIRVIRVRESYEVETVTVPYEHQVIRNDALPPEESRIIQAGMNGRQEITYRLVTEDNLLVSRTPVKTLLLDEPVAEILMVGSLSGFQTITIAGSLAYVDSGNAWLILQNTSNRIPILTSGNIDPRIFSLSYDREWLLFTFHSKNSLNELAVIQLSAAASMQTLPIANVFSAEWSPLSNRQFFLSTMLPVSTAPGWQANNDLRLIRLKDNSSIDADTPLLVSNASGLYAWWGTNYAWNHAGSRIGYTRSNSIGWLDLATGNLQLSATITPYLTHSDWVWLPPINWSSDDQYMLSVLHGAPSGLELPETSPLFHLAAFSMNGGAPILLAERVGMFAFPVANPASANPNMRGYNVAFLQALRPLESNTSNYRLCLIDRDGSNQRCIFPPEGEAGLEPQQIKWSPDGRQIALLYEGNIWIVDVEMGRGQQITSDGQVTAFDWR